MMRWPTKREVWIGSTLLAAILVWSGRFFVNPDGISYLDLSDSVQAGRFADAVNLHWSPAYPYLLALWLSPLSPGSPWESTAVHILNGVLFLGALRAFDFFLDELERSQPQSSRHALRLDTRGGRFAAYAIFLWCALVLVTIRAVTPDMLVTLLGFTAAGLFVRIKSDRAGRGPFAALGLTLGLAALAKAFMFPVAVLMIAIMLIGTRRARLLLLTIAFFAVTVVPQVAALSIKSGKLTIGESARIVYLLKVNRIPKLGEGIVYFPTDTPDRTYPLWDDPAALYSGMAVRFDVADQLNATRNNLVTLAGLGLKILAPLLIVVALRDRKSRMTNRSLVAIASLVLATYLLLFTEARLVGFWIALLVAAALAGITLSEGKLKHEAGRGFIHVITLVSVISFVTYVIDQAFSSRPDRGLNGRNVSAQVASAVNRACIPPGSRIALVGDESDIYWARLARVQIAAQIPLRAADGYMSLPPDALSRINEQFASVGARGIVASWVDTPPRMNGWIQVDNFRIFSFNRDTTSINGRIRTLDCR
ncbi:MAG TPA: hypothetical protein VF042_09735 [Gemmatimonadaceae bacterium]